MALPQIYHVVLTTDSTYFPPITEDGKLADESLDYDTEEEQDDGLQTEAATEILSQLPDAPTDEPVNVEDAQQPSQKKQKTEETPDDFVIVEKEDTDETKPKAEL